ncbi:MAG TPA: YciI family protein [Planctomycetota bacterium]|nr:YciI family protein [Planctomycetota bacterium]
MRFMVIVKANRDSEAGKMPSRELLAAMGKYNEELVRAGVMLGADGLQPSSKGARVKFEGSKRTVTDGPFAESKELIAGYWIWKVASKQEAIDWLKRAPFDGGTEVELRQIHEMEDFGKEMTPELREQEKSQMQRAEANKKR